VLTTNQGHLLATPQERESISRLLQYVGRRYVSYINHTYGRSGTLWEGRFKASIVDASEYLMACYRYIELNPVRAGMVAAPKGYRWPSYRANAQGAADPVVSPHEMCLGLGADERARQVAYRALFRGLVADRDLEDIRTCLQSGTPLGNERFRAEIERI
jgi:putative transposase